MKLLFIAAALLVAVDAQYSNPTCRAGTHVIVHLFNWLWTDIEKECAAYLGPKGYCGVQISPPSEHRVISGRPWWERYQPVSYILGSRSGNREQFISMVEKCHDAGVRIYVDMVVNHMTGAGGSGTGSAGSSFDADTLNFPAVPFGPNDFNCCQCSMCTTGSCDIESYNDVNQVRNCRLVSLLDLKLGADYVRTKIADFFNDLIGIGVAGFRVDACKHMWPGDIQAVYNQVNNLNTQWFPANTRPFIFNEVIDLGGEAISGSEYTHLGRITEFKYCNHIANAFRKNYPLSDLKNLGEEWGMLPSGSSLVFVDNHDNQRGHGAGGANILTMYEPKPYKAATIYTLAWPYGHPRILSSYKWPGGPSSNDGTGPPTNNGDDIKAVVINADGSCDDGSSHTWTCEHRWRQIGNMAAWRNSAGGETWNVDNWWDDGGNQLSFSRNGAAFIAFNWDNSGTLTREFQTGMPAGSYCDIISGDPTSSGCSGATITVNSGGGATFSIDASSDDPIVAIHAGAESGSG
jgi:alpha-amylase